MSRVIRALVIVLVLAGAGCSSPNAPSSELRGGVVATFAVGSERFKVYVRNAAAIDRLFQLQTDPSATPFPNGRIRRGAGAAQHNVPHGWHLDPQDIEIVDAAIELCDGSPSYVDANLGEYVDVIGRYCPWGARLVKIDDYR